MAAAIRFIGSRDPTCMRFASGIEIRILATLGRPRACILSYWG
jgi:hypothetical protein